MEQKPDFTVAVVGLGLIGGSFCRRMREATSWRILGVDTDGGTLEEALADGAIHQGIRPEEIPSGALSQADFVLVALHPRQTIAFLLENGRYLKPGALAADTCGIKAAVVKAVSQPLSRQGIRFVGTHPMAGREFSGYRYSLPTLFEGASFIVTPQEAADGEALDFLREFSSLMGFGKFVVTTPAQHDETIAFTSQLAHVVSNAYVKSPSLLRESGFSAGSFLDLTRVAKLNEDMWTDLFLMNRTPLLFELETILGSLKKYRDALLAENEQELKALLRQGRQLKEESLRRHEEAKKADHPERTGK
ncbi:MAG: prephenate dehydrogenase [Oscillospiraceae bacterium]